MTSVRRSFRRPVPVLAALVAGALLVTGCSGGLVGSSPAASVGDTDISRADVEQRVEDYRAFVNALGDAAEAQRQESEASGQGSISADDLAAQIAQELTPYDGGPGAIGAEGAATQLSELLGDAILAAALADAGGKVTADQRDAARTTISDSLSQRGASLEDMPKGLMDSYIEFEAMRQALQATAPKDLRAAVEDAPAQYEAQLQQAFEGNKASYEQVCVRLLTTTDRAAAESAIARVEAGESFAEVAAEVSTSEPGAGQEPNCYDAAGISQVFAGQDPQVGDVLGPAEDQGRFVVVEVDERREATYDEVRDRLTQSIPDTFTPAAQAALDEYVADALRKAARDVWVDPRYGTWDAEVLRVVPNPSSAITTTTSLPVATLPAGS